MLNHKKKPLSALTDSELDNALYLEKLIQRAINEQMGKPEAEMSLDVVNWLVAQRTV